MLELHSPMNDHAPDGIIHILGLNNTFDKNNWTQSETEPARTALS